MRRTIWSLGPMTLLFCSISGAAIAQNAPALPMPAAPQVPAQAAGTAATAPTSAAPPAAAPAVPITPAAPKTSDSGGFFSSLPFMGGDDEDKAKSPADAAAAKQAAEKLRAQQAQAKLAAERAAQKSFVGRIPLPVKKPQDSYWIQNLPRTISKKSYSKENSYLPQAVYIEEHVHLLFNSIERGNIEVARALLGKYKGVDVRDREGDTPLIYAVMAGNAQITSMLLGMYANVDVHNVYGTTPLHAAAQGGRPDLAQMLIKAGESVNDIDQSGMTPLMVAAERGFDNVVNILLDASAKINLRRKDGNTALHLACVNPVPNACYSLLRHGADMEIRNFEGLTPLMMAAAHGAAPDVTVLLKAGADTVKTDAQGRKASDLATFGGYPDVAKAIESETIRRTMLANRLEQMRTYGRYRPHNKLPETAPTVYYGGGDTTPVMARRKHGIPIPVPKPTGVADQQQDYLPLYRQGTSASKVPAGVVRSYNIPAARPVQMAPNTPSVPMGGSAPVQGGAAMPQAAGGMYGAPPSGMRPPMPQDYGLPPSSPSSPVPQSYGAPQGYQPPSSPSPYQTPYQGMAPPSAPAETPTDPMRLFRYF